MSDYTKVTNFTAKDTANDTILGSDFETELGAVQTMSTTKSNKVSAPTVDDLASLSGTGDLQDSGLKASKTPQLDASVSFEKEVVFDEVVDNSSGGSWTTTWANGNKQKRTMSSAGTATFTAPSGPCNLVLQVTNSGAARTITWPAAVKWPSSVIPTPSGAAKVDIYVFFYDGTNYYGSMLGDY